MAIRRCNRAASGTLFAFLGNLAEGVGAKVVAAPGRRGHREREMNDQTLFEGGCLCGAIRYRSTQPPLRGVICHCSMCRKHSGAPALAFVHFPRAAFAWAPDEPARYRSSPNAERGFCPRCGSTLSMHEEVLADRVQIAVGSLDRPERVRIDDHVWTRERIPWFDVADGLPRFPGSSDAVPSKAAADDSITA